MPQVAPGLPCPYPSIPIIPIPAFCAWPATAGQCISKVGYLPLQRAFSEQFHTDAHFQAIYVPELPYRLKKSVLEDGQVVHMSALVFDVDGPSHTATEEWWYAEKAKLQKLFDKGVPFVYRTRGGYRIVYQVNWTLTSASSGKEWSILYLQSVLDLAENFDIIADPACSDWTRLFRLPHATRQDSSNPEALETLGDPQNISFAHIDQGTESISGLLSETSIRSGINTANRLHVAENASLEAGESTRWLAVARRLTEAVEPQQTALPANKWEWNGRCGSRRAAVALESEAASLATCVAGGRNPACNTASCKLGHYVASGELDESDVRQALESAMISNGSVKKYGISAVRRTISSGLKAGKQTPPSTPPRKDPHMACHATTEAYAHTPKTTPDSKTKPELSTETSDTEHLKEEREGPKFLLTELGNAERLCVRYGHVVRYCLQRKLWLIWDGTRWKWDEVEVFRLAKKIAKSIHNEAKNCKDDDLAKAIRKHAKESESTSKIKAVVSSLKSEPLISIDANELDSHKMLFNCRNGTIDLKTGELKKHNKFDYLTRISEIDYDPEARSPFWEQFLSDVTMDNQELSGFLARVVGWAMTGGHFEKKFCFFYGAPDTGKSTFLDAISKAFGSYAERTDFETWCRQTHTGGNRGDLTRLKGARLVTSSEIRKGAKFDSKLMKSATGGDPIIAADKYEKTIEFEPQFTLIFAANDKAEIDESDKGMMDRLLCIPFDNVIPIEKRSPKVRERLISPETWPAIIAWAVKGCLEWQEKGLHPASCVYIASDKYRTAMDRFGGFFDMCERKFVDVDEKLVIVNKTVFYNAYKQWCFENGKKPLSRQEVSSRMQKSGINSTKRNGSRYWQGIELPDDYQE